MARRTSRLKRLGVLVGLGLAAATVAQELRKPQAERTWHGDLYGIPYDYRPPTIEKLKATYWAPDDERILMPKAWGFGWDLNVGRLVRVASEAMSGAMSGAGARTGAGWGSGSADGSAPDLDARSRYDDHRSEGANNRP